MPVFRPIKEGPKENMRGASNLRIETTRVLFVEFMLDQTTLFSPRRQDVQINANQILKNKYHVSPMDTKRTC